MVKRPKPIKGIKKYFHRNRPSIQEIVRENESGGIVYRRNKKGEIQFLLYQDPRERWTIPKGHIEKGESAKQAAEREIQEETGLQDMKVKNWLGKIHYRYRRQQSLVMVTMQVYLVEAKGNTDKLKKEEWMYDLGWFNQNEALDRAEYDDVGKLILLAMKKIRTQTQPNS